MTTKKKASQKKQTSRKKAPRKAAVASKIPAKKAKKKASKRISREKQPTKIRRKLGFYLIIIGVLVAAFPALTIPYGLYKQSLLRQKWERQAQKYMKRSRSSLSSALPDMDKTPQGRSGPFPPTKIIIPKIGLEQAVGEGISNKVLREGPGHYPKTANPGEVGWCAMAGHRVTFSRSFNRLDELKKGDQIILETPEARFVYVVFKVEQVLASSTFKMEATSLPKVALTTCAPEGSARYRLVARGALAPFPLSTYLKKTKS